MKRINVVNEFGEHIGFLFYDNLFDMKVCYTRLYRGVVVRYWSTLDDAATYLYDLGLQLVC